MKQADWDAVAADYSSHIFSVFDHDAEGQVRRRIFAQAQPGGRAADLGCGVGNFTPLLADAFGRVEACDWSAACLLEAERRCAGRRNIRFHQLDFIRQTSPFEPVDFVLCANVLIMPDLDQRLRAWRLVTNQVRSGGTLLLVVPSHESMLYLDFRSVDWRLAGGSTCEEAVRQILPQTGSVRDLHQGVRPLEGVRTKHYLREELAVLLDDHGMDVLEIAKLEYPWSAVFEHPAESIKGPRTWNWLATARRRAL